MPTVVLLRRRDSKNQISCRYYRCFCLSVGLTLQLERDTLPSPPEPVLKLMLRRVGESKRSQYYRKMEALSAYLPSYERIDGCHYEEWTEFVGNEIIHKLKSRFYTAGLEADSGPSCTIAAV